MENVREYWKTISLPLLITGISGETRYWYMLISSNT